MSQDTKKLADVICIDQQQIKEHLGQMVRRTGEDTLMVDY